MGTVIDVAPHPTLDLRACVVSLPDRLDALTVPSGAALAGGLTLDAPAPMRREESVRAAVRDLLRHGGFKPSGRSKPASEYLVRAAGQGALRRINPVVDACNVASLHSGLPMSVIDLDRATPPFTTRVADPGTRVVFNPAGQEIDVGGLLCLFDADGPTANAVKDAQRTKTHGGTRRVLAVVWGTVEAPGRAERTAAWYQELLEAIDATCEPCPLRAVRD